MVYSFRVAAAEAGERLDRWLATRCAAEGVTRSRIQSFLRLGAVRVNGQLVRAATRLKPNDSVELEIPDVAEKQDLVAEPFTLAVLYEDEQLIAIDKPAGMVVHPGAGRAEKTVVHQLLARCPLSSLGGSDRPGIVHRLDEGTSGVLLIAKTDEAYRRLVQQFQAREIEKIYLALVEGVVAEDEGRIEGALGRDPAHRQRMRIIATGKPAITEFRVLQRFTGNTLLEVRPLTGRTHQIRVHLKAIGHAVAGETVYGKSREIGHKRMMLHAWQLRLTHPITVEKLHLVSPLPEEFARLLSEARARDAIVIERRDV